MQELKLFEDEDDLEDAALRKFDRAGALLILAEFLKNVLASVDQDRSGLCGDLALHFHDIFGQGNIE